jgi:hypothetical protein
VISVITDGRKSGAGDEDGDGAALEDGDGAALEDGDGAALEVTGELK